MSDDLHPRHARRLLASVVTRVERGADLDAAIRAAVWNDADSAHEGENTYRADVLALHHRVYVAGSPREAWRRARHDHRSVC